MEWLDLNKSKPDDLVEVLFKCTEQPTGRKPKGGTKYRVGIFVKGELTQLGDLLYFGCGLIATHWQPIEDGEKIFIEIKEPVRIEIGKIK